MLSCEEDEEVNILCGSDQAVQNDGESANQDIPRPFSIQGAAERGQVFELRGS